MEQADSDATQHANSNGHLQLHRRIDEAEPRIRVGSLYQAILPPFAPPVSPPSRPLARPVDDTDADSAEARFGVSEAAEDEAGDEVGGRALWLASRIKQSRTRQSRCLPTPEWLQLCIRPLHRPLTRCHLLSRAARCAVDSYLQFVQTLFHKSQVSNSRTSKTPFRGPPLVEPAFPPSLPPSLLGRC